jgi:hypothetical protein
MILQNDPATPISSIHPAVTVSKAIESVILAGGYQARVKVGSFQAEVGFDEESGDVATIYIRGTVDTHDQADEALESIRAEGLSCAWDFSVSVSDVVVATSADDLQSGSVVA